MTTTNNQTWEERAKAFEERAHHIRDMMDRMGITEEQILKDFKEWKSRRSSDPSTQNDRGLPK